ncbi:MAG: 30S ribosomal protein S17 [Candidatus Levybacteria bacterium CG10_big_fil_rev_8_21_14_0_10_36_7]|nr:MAG: 30S ribosomal protein S17 [Candidatus Levybacteria bacterium CG10_big_fil_rev_8_21_14_0_10_36_7]
MALKTLTGKVVSNKMNSTVVVEVSRRVQHPIYKKMLKKIKRFKASTNGLEVAEGVIVKIQQTRPMSSSVRFKVVEVLKGGLS